MWLENTEHLLCLKPRFPYDFAFEHPKMLKVSDYERLQGLSLTQSYFVVEKEVIKFVDNAGLLHVQ